MSHGDERFQVPEQSRIAKSESREVTIDSVIDEGHAVTIDAIADEGIKLIIFDVDGVLVDTDELHFLALNQALCKLNYGFAEITRDQHECFFKGLPTKVKLKALKAKYPSIDVDAIHALKQELTAEHVQAAIKPRAEHVQMIQQLSQQYKLAACSNALESTTRQMLKCAGLIKYFDKVVGADTYEDCKPKPSIGMYCKIGVEVGVHASQTLIFEDSEVGLEAARNVERSHYAFVDDLYELNYDLVQKHIRRVGMPRVVIPMGGNGRRFQEAGYIEPKPLIMVKDKMMFEWVIEDIGEYKDNFFIFVVRREHCVRWNMETCIRSACDDRGIREYEIVVMEDDPTRNADPSWWTNGTACGVLTARRWIDSRAPMLLANSDQTFSYGEVVTNLRCDCNTNHQCAILTFESHHPKWSYVARDEDGRPIGVVEKNPVSDEATVGVYLWTHGYLFVQSVQKMIAANDRTMGEFYVAPSITHLVNMGHSITTVKLQPSMFSGFGTPQDLVQYLRDHE